MQNIPFSSTCSFHYTYNLSKVTESIMLGFCELSVNNKIFLKNFIAAFHDKSCWEVIERGIEGILLSWQASKRVEIVNQHFVLMMSKTTKKLGLIDVADLTTSFCTRIIKNKVQMQ